MTFGRGALIVLEGCDRAGKSTQVKMLIDALNKRQVSAGARAFPNRSTPIGGIINNFLLTKQELPPEAAHLLFSANRWECKDEIVKTLQSGTTLIIDRYAGSGTAYTAATSDRSIAWCKIPDKGLPSPDLVILLKVSEACQQLRSNWGVERFENSTLQQRVAANYEKLKDETWSTIDADQDKLIVHSEILTKVLKVIELVKDQPIRILYESL